MDATIGEVHQTSFKITPETDPANIERVGGALVYILKSHNVPVTPSELFRNTERLTEADLRDLIKYEVTPGTLQLFYPSQKNYFDELRKWRAYAAWKNDIGPDKGLAYEYSLFKEGKITHVNAVGIIDARECSQGPCTGSVYAFDFPLIPSLFESKIRDKTCANKPVMICKKIIGAVVGTYEGIRETS